MALSPAERTLKARLAAHKSWSGTADPSARTAPGRRAFEQRFLDAVDPDRVLPEDERNRRAAHERQAYFLRLSLKAATAKRKKAEASQAEQTALAELARATEQVAQASDGE